MSSTRQSSGRSRTSENSESQQGEENGANGHQGQHPRENKEEFYRSNQTGESNSNSLGLQYQRLLLQ